MTFNKDIAPIVFGSCAPCHRPGEVAPFSLLSYADTVKHADTIVKETSKRHMPPWSPEPGEVPILGDRRLRDDQIAAIQRWVAGGKIEGNPADLPKFPVWTEGWRLGRPDLVLTAERPRWQRRDAPSHQGVELPAGSRIKLQPDYAPAHGHLTRLQRLGIR